MDKSGTIRHLLRRPFVTAREDDDLAMILQIMRWAEVRHLPIVRGDALLGILPVVDGNERLAGIVSYADVLRAALGPQSQTN